MFSAPFFLNISRFCKTASERRKNVTEGRNAPIRKECGNAIAATVPTRKGSAKNSILWTLGVFIPLSITPPSG